MKIKTYVCVYICVCVYIYIYIYTHTHIYKIYREGRFLYIQEGKIIYIYRLHVYEIFPTYMCLLLHLLNSAHSPNSRLIMSNNLSSFYVQGDLLQHNRKLKLIHQESSASISKKRKENFGKVWAIYSRSCNQYSTYILLLQFRTQVVLHIFLIKSRVFSSISQVLYYQSNRFSAFLNNRKARSMYYILQHTYQDNRVIE